MEDGDDDFGDLYADVEVEPSSAMNDAQQISQLQLVSDETGKRNSALEPNSDKEDRVSDGDEEDDDDDDLNIVLNSDDDSVRHGDCLTIPRTNTILRSGELDDEDDDNFGTEECAGGKAVCNSHSSYKYSRSQSAAFGSELKGRGCGPQHGQRFSLPWSRSILDVNIDVFEQKPWKHPGADITDYFNFGLNEHSWKLYCNQVDEYRHREPMSSGSPPSESAQLMERKGRAIQVEDSIIERQSSMDVRRQMDRDSDVIQITIVDSEDHCCGSTKEGSRNLENCVPESSKSNHGDDSGDNETDHISFSSASEDESFEGNHLETEINDPKRVSYEEIRTSDNTKERTGEDTCTTDLSILVAESSEAEKSPNKPFEDRWKCYSHERHSSTELTRSMKAGYHHSQDMKRSDNHRYQSDKRKHGDYNSPVYNNRTCKDYKPKHKFHHENDDIIFSRRQDEKRKPFEGRYHARRHGNLVNNHRMYERVHTFDPYNEERMLYSKESEPPLDYYHGERYERFGPKMGRPVFRSLEEEEYYEARRYSDEFGWNDKRNGNKGVKDEFFLDREYCDDIKGENFRCFGYNEREKDEFEDEHVKHLAFTRWVFRSPRRNKRRFSSQKFEESHSHINNGRCYGNMMPRSSFYERKRSYEEQLSERFRYNDYEPFDRIEDYKMDYDDRMDVARSGVHYWQSEVKWKEDEIMMMPFEESIDDVYMKGRKCNFEKSSKFEYEGSYEWVFKGGVDSFDRHKVDGCDDVDDLIANKQKRQVISGKKCRKSYGEIGKKLSPSSLDSHVVVREGKSCKKQPQAVTEEVNTRLAHGNDGNGLQNRKEKTGVDKSRILEARVKMEKRRARFNEAVTCTKMDSDGTTTKVSVQEMGSNKSQRPARKRRWGGS
ncbi:hypothetical protein L1887_28383 [Cichorium endivia]|nr:hypothetical protein L1887_28383 [Cichorium endivia]